MQKVRKVSMPNPSKDFYIVEQGHLSFLFEVHGECKEVVDITATARLQFFQKLRESKELPVPIAVEAPKQRVAGLHSGAAQMSDDFDEPLKANFAE